MRTTSDDHPFVDPRPDAPQPDGRSSRDMVVDRLRCFSRFEDPRAGRVERQALLHTLAGPIFLTLVEPLGVRRSVGFLICHSFAWEQLDLYPLELAFARQAASAGFPALYFHARGYGDSGGDFADATLASQVRDALAAAEHLREVTGVETVVPAGARWGAAVALMVAGRIDAPGVALWNGSLDPGAYLKDMLRAYARSRIAAGPRPPGEPALPSGEQLEAALASGERIDLLGYPLTSACYVEAGRTDPFDALDRRVGRALLVVVNPRTRGEAEDVAARLGGLGADVRVEHADGPGRAQFGLGLSNYSARRVTTSPPLYLDVARRTVRWAEEAWAADPVPAPVGVGFQGSPAAPREAPMLEGGPAEDLGTIRSPLAVADVPLYVPSRDESLGAVVTVPDDPTSSVGVVLLAGRARDRGHRNGLWVKAARMLAEDGLYVLRIDYPGVGNSTGPPQLFSLDELPARAIEDACRFLVEQTPVRHILLAGTCFGGRVVLEAAPAIPEVEGVAVVVAPLSTRPVSPKRQIGARAMAFLHQRGRSARDPTVEASGQNGGAQLPKRPVDPAFARALERFLERGRVYFLYGDQDVVWEELRLGLDDLRLPSDRYEVELVPGAIHTFRSLTMQALALERLTAWCRRSALDLRERR